jgi:hypothetical protein
MKTHLSLLGITTLVSLTPLGGVSADALRGKTLHDSRCTSCHDSSVYTRPDHKIRSLDALRAQVSRCSQAAGANWSGNEISDVVEYLDQNYYRFGQPGT